MVDDALLGIARDLRRCDDSLTLPKCVRLESSLWNAIRREILSRPYITLTVGEHQRPRLFGCPVLVDETMPAGTWRLEHG